MRAVGVWWWQRVEEVRKACVQSSRRWDSHCLLSSSSLFRLYVALFYSNPRPLKTSRRPPLIMTRLSNPIAVAQTQGSALNPLVSDCFSRVKWLCPPCHSPGHRSSPPWLLGAAETRALTPGWVTHSSIHTDLIHAMRREPTQKDTRVVISQRAAKIVFKKK